jgi:putative pyruvate formate lyase activating enzyme
MVPGRNARLYDNLSVFENYDFVVFSCDLSRKQHHTASKRLVIINGKRALTILQFRVRALFRVAGLARPASWHVEISRIDSRLSKKSQYMRREIMWNSTVPLELAGGGRFVIPRHEFVPAYVKTYEEGRLCEKAEEALELLRSCHVCPRDCKVNRLQNKTGICKSGRLARVTSAFTHFGEEDCLRGWNGSGTIFFAWCNLRCVFCQNFETSQQGEGKEVTASQLAAIMLELQNVGCHNINFVTPEHVVPQILEALLIAINRGLRLPLVYNTSSYDSMESIKFMDGVIDIYMPDFKLWDPQRSLSYLLARDYPDAARRVVKAMHEQVGELRVDENGLALRGVIVRHLVMPGMLEDTGEIVRWLAGELSPDTYVNVMDQYYPAWKAKTEAKFSEISRGIWESEFEQALSHARKAGLWRLNRRWRAVRPRLEFVEVPPAV